MIFSVYKFFQYVSSKLFAILKGVRQPCEEFSSKITVLFKFENKLDTIGHCNLNFKSHEKYKFECKVI